MSSWYPTTVNRLLEIDSSVIVGELASQAISRRYDVTAEARSAWEFTVDAVTLVAQELVKQVLGADHFGVLFEYEIPRRSKRIDVVLLAGRLILPIEFKVGSSEFTRADKWQALGYALDLRDFHYESRNKRIIPILVASESAESERLHGEVSSDEGDVLTCSLRILPKLIIETVRSSEAAPQPQIDISTWDKSQYRPTPNIIEAARELYLNHGVREIADAGSINLTYTVDAVIEFVDECRRLGRRGIIFITGAPGSGKTLAGLQVVHDPRLSEIGESPSVFLSGNMPLVEVIREALASDRTSRGRDREHRQRRIDAFIQHAYVFREEYSRNVDNVPPEHIVMFDEAQRAWSERQVMKFTRGNATGSEPAMLLEVMARVPRWSVIIALVGNGQEINSGEAGISEWGSAIRAARDPWQVWASPQVVNGGEGIVGEKLFQHVGIPSDLVMDERLHLTMNVRSPRAERLNLWVNGLLELNLNNLESSMPDPDEYPIVMTRSLETAKSWLRDRMSDHHRAGLLASAGARRLRFWGLDTRLLRNERSWKHWFLKPSGDVRSSIQLESVATNFDCQGLELDWGGVCWGGDFLPTKTRDEWRCRTFKGTRWQSSGEEQSRYTRNGYRVLLTRARRGMVIWVPEPDGTDRTLNPKPYTDLTNLLADAGVRQL